MGDVLLLVQGELQRGSCVELILMIVICRQDCTAISNARATGCERSVCAVYSCFDGYVVSPDRLSCVKRGTATPATPITAVTMGDQVILGDVPLTT